MWKICFLLAILVITVYAAPAAPPAEEKYEPVKFDFVVSNDFLQV